MFRGIWETIYDEDLEIKEPLEPVQCSLIMLYCSPERSCNMTGMIGSCNNEYLQGWAKDVCFPSNHRELTFKDIYLVIFRPTKCCINIFHFLRKTNIAHVRWPFIQSWPLVSPIPTKEILISTTLFVYFFSLAFQKVPHFVNEIVLW